MKISSITNTSVYHSMYLSPFYILFFKEYLNDQASINNM